MRGRIAPDANPKWDPLLGLAPEEVDDFMWMFEVQLEDGATAQAYKHWWTRRYLYLDHDGRALVYVKDGLYEEVEPRALLEKYLES